MKNGMLLTLALLLLASCATVTRGTTDIVAVGFWPPDATVTSTSGAICTNGSCSIGVSRKMEFTLTAAKEGYIQKVVPIRTMVGGTGAAGAAGNILIGGIIGLGIDAASGAAKDHVPNPVYIVLEPIDPLDPKTPPPTPEIRAQERITASIPGTQDYKPAGR